MELEATRKDRIAALRDEIQKIEFANKLYWEGKTLSPEASNDCQRRLERLKEIRLELIELQG